MIDRPKFSKYVYAVHKFLDEEQPRVHEDVELRPGEKVGIVIGNKRYVLTIDSIGKLSVKTQKKVTRWEDEED